MNFSADSESPRESPRYHEREGSPTWKAELFALRHWLVRLDLRGQTSSNLQVDNVFACAGRSGRRTSPLPKGLV
jgi:hypothetical protein